MLPIAWAIIEMETTLSYIWFLHELKLDLCSGDRVGWLLVSDMQKVSDKFH